MPQMRLGCDLSVRPPAKRKAAVYLPGLQPSVRFPEATAVGGKPSGLPEMRHHPESREKILTLLNGDGVRTIIPNELTGSVIVRYDADVTSADRLLEPLHSSGYFEDRAPFASPVAPFQRTANRTAERVGKALFSWAVGRILENSGLSIIAALI